MHNEKEIDLNASEVAQMPTNLLGIPICNAHFFIFDIYVPYMFIYSNQLVLT